MISDRRLMRPLPRCSLPAALPLADACHHASRQAPLEAARNPSASSRLRVGHPARTRLEVRSPMVDGGWRGAAAAAEAGSRTWRRRTSSGRGCRGESIRGHRASGTATLADRGSGPKRCRLAASPSRPSGKADRNEDRDLCHDLEVEFVSEAFTRFRCSDRPPLDSQQMKSASPEGGSFDTS